MKQKRKYYRKYKTNSDWLKGVRLLFCLPYDKPSKKLGSLKVEGLHILN